MRVTKEWFVEYGYPICFPSIEVLTIGAGGGSLAWIDEAGSLRNGPQSAGADPGPACYGRGNDAADEHRRQPRARPPRRRADRRGDAARPRRRPSSAIDEHVAEPLGLEPRRGGRAPIIQVANANMADAVRLISIRRGYDPREFALVVFGGAGPLHGAALARGAVDPDRARAAEPGHHLGARLPARRRPPRPVGDVPARTPTRSTRRRSRPSSTKLEDEARERLAAEGVPDEQMSACSARSTCATSASGARCRSPSSAPLDLADGRRAGSTPSTSASTTTAATARRSRSTGSSVQRGRRDAEAASSRGTSRRRRAPSRAARRARSYFDRRRRRRHAASTVRDDLPAGVAVRRARRSIDQLDSTTVVPPGVAGRGRRVAEHPHAHREAAIMSTETRATRSIPVTFEVLKNAFVTSSTRWPSRSCAPATRS